MRTMDARQAFSCGLPGRSKKRILGASHQECLCTCIWYAYVACLCVSIYIYSMIYICIYVCVHLHIYIYVYIYVGRYAYYMPVCAYLI